MVYPLCPNDGDREGASVRKEEVEGEDHLHCCCYKSLDFGDDGSGKQTMDYQGFRLCIVVIYMTIGLGTVKEMGGGLGSGVGGWEAFYHTYTFLLESPDSEEEIT